MVPCIHPCEQMKTNGYRDLSKVVFNCGYKHEIIRGSTEDKKNKTALGKF